MVKIRHIHPEIVHIEELREEIPDGETTEVTEYRGVERLDVRPSIPPPRTLGRDRLLALTHRGRAFLHRAYHCHHRYRAGVELLGLVLWAGFTTLSTAVVFRLIVHVFGLWPGFVYAVLGLATGLLSGTFYVRWRDLYGRIYLGMRRVK